MRPRRANSMRDLVRQGKARVVLPSTDTGFRGYRVGRRVLIAADADNTVSTATVLNYNCAAPWKPVANRFTVAARFHSTATDPNDGTTSNVLSFHSSAKSRLYHVSRVWIFEHSGGTTASVTQSKTWTAGTPGVVIARMTASGDDPSAKLDLNVDGTNAAQVADTGTQDMSLSSRINIGTQPNGTTEVSIDVGPLLWSPVRKSQAWTDAIAAANWSNPVALYERFCNDVGDVLFPYVGSTVGYMRVSGAFPFDELYAHATGDYVLFAGDSITLGTGVADYDNRWSDRLLADALSGYDSDNIAVGGYTSLTVLNEFGYKVFPKYGPSRTTNLLCLLIGTNDLIGVATPETIYGRINSYVTAAKAQGWTVIVGTVPSNSDLAAGREADRDTLNALIVTNSAGADAVADMTGDDYMDDGNFLTQPTYWYNAAHPNDAGNGVIASYFTTAIGTL